MSFLVTPTVLTLVHVTKFQLCFRIRSHDVMYLVIEFSSNLFSIFQHFHHVQIISLLGYALFNLYVCLAFVLSCILSTFQVLMHTLVQQLFMM